MRSMPMAICLMYSSWYCTQRISICLSVSDTWFINCNGTAPHRPVSILGINFLTLTITDCTFCSLVIQGECLLKENRLFQPFSNPIFKCFCTGDCLDIVTLPETVSFTSVSFLLDGWGNQWCHLLLWFLEAFVLESLLCDLCDWSLLLSLRTAESWTEWQEQSSIASALVSSISIGSSNNVCVYQQRCWWDCLGSTQLASSWRPQYLY